MFMSELGVLEDVGFISGSQNDHRQIMYYLYTSIAQLENDIVLLSLTLSLWLINSLSTSGQGLPLPII